MNNNNNNNEKTPEVVICAHCHPNLSYYYSSLPGLLRLTSLVLGLVCIILSSIGFEDDFRREEEWLTPYAFITFYGVGYNEERANIWSLIITCICFTTSAMFALLIITTEGAVERWQLWNRFLHLSLAFLLLCGWFSGGLGLLLFRQGCCRVEMLGSERITHDLDGYPRSCLCFINPHNDPENSYPVLLYQDAPTGVNFIKAQPHHFSGHITNLVLMLLNVGVYFLSAWEI